MSDLTVPLRVFLGIGAFVFAIGAVYWATAYEEGGTVMLLLAGALSLWIGGYFWLRQRAVAAVGDGEVERPADGTDQYLPHASAWPFAIGLGAATLANGLVLGMWVIVPGAFLLVLGVGGFVRQTRRRD